MYLSTRMCLFARRYVTCPDNAINTAIFHLNTVCFQVSWYERRDNQEVVELGETDVNPIGCISGKVQVFHCNSSVEVGRLCITSDSCRQQLSTPFTIQADPDPPTSTLAGSEVGQMRGPGVVFLQKPRCGTQVARSTGHGAPLCSQPHLVPTTNFLTHQELYGCRFHCACLVSF